MVSYQRATISKIDIIYCTLTNSDQNNSRTPWTIIEVTFKVSLLEGTSPCKVKFVGKDVITVTDQLLNKPLDNTDPIKTIRELVGKECIVYWDDFMNEVGVFNTEEVDIKQ